MMKSNLSHILPVWKASRILGEPVVRRIVLSVMRLRSRATQQQQQQNSDHPTEEEEVNFLLKGLFFEGSGGMGGSTRSLNDSSNSLGGSQNKPVPPVILHAWKSLMGKRALALDKPTLFRLLIPFPFQPHSGTHGHMGLFDCFSYALQGHGTTSNAAPGAPPAPGASSLIHIPDIIIFFAVCQQYTNRCWVDVNDDDEDPDAALLKQKSVHTMSVMAYRIYDSFQKRGIVTRDTIQRFLTDIYGDQSHKEPRTRAYLDDLFTISTAVPPSSKSSASQAASINDILNNPNGQANAAENANAMSPNNAQTSLHATLTETQFCKQMLEVQREEESDDESNQILLDWIAHLALSMMPLEKMPPSTLAYLETIENSYRPVCAIYKLAEHRLYEIKRRFHSLVESSVTVLEGDVVEDCSNANEKTQSQMSPIQQTHTNLPKHVITLSAFTRAVVQPNSEMGHGGHLPTTLAQWTFRAGCSHPHDRTFWGLYDVLKFGCEAVRCINPEKINPDIPLLKFIYSIFTLNHDQQEDGDINNMFDDNYISHSASSENSKDCEELQAGQEKRCLNRKQIGQMLCRLMEHSEFRFKADSPPSSLDDIEEEKNNGEDDNIVDSLQGKQQQNPLEDESNNYEDTLVSISAASFLGLLPPKYDKHQTKNENHVVKVPLSVLIDYFLQQGQSESSTYATFDTFYRWHYNENNTSSNFALSQRRLGPFMLELRLISAVLFGIPPTQASMEVALIAEIQRRHKHRHPPTEVSRRGPKGTVWYIIDHRWYQAWTALVQTVSDSQMDALDGRGDNPPSMNTVPLNNPNSQNPAELKSGSVPPATAGKGPRGLGKINNRPLMADNGSLALRSDIRWRHDYEILPPLAWSALQAWYDGGPPIHRTVVPYVPSTGTASPHSRVPRIRTENEIELYPFFVTVFMCDAASRGEARPFQQYVPVSRVSPVRVILLQLCKGLDVDPDYGRLWVMGATPEDNPSIQAAGQQSSNNENSTNGSASEDWLLNLDMNIVEQMNRRHTKHHSSNSITLLLELKDSDSTGLWPRGKDGKKWSFHEKVLNGDAAETGDGIVGLYNMGNTCYLNASIQCLSHTPVFRDYFTTKSYLNDINTTNPLGHQGRLAQVSAVLISSLWKRFNQSVPHQPRRVTSPGTHFPVSAPNLTPKTFKESLGKFNDHFSGNEQHDAQELLAFLLGGLSEDLNRIVDKPYIEAPDSDGRPDSELADIWWNNHLKREFSIIVALFTGQYKSLLTCRSCKYESARFEPFSFLQLPLPEDDHICAQLILYPRKENAAVLKYSVRVRNDGKLFDLLVALAKLLYEDENNENLNGSGCLSQPQNVEQLEDDRQRGKDGDNKSQCGSETSQDREMEEMCIRRAKNLAVVDMRDSFISKVASFTWLLTDLQNKDTGEIPCLHTYELDPLAEEEFAPSENNNVDSGLKKSDTNNFDSDGDEEEDDEEASDDEEENTDSNDRRPSGPAPSYSFLAFVQRKCEVVSRDLLHPFVPRVFGTPLLLRLADLENWSGRQLYDLVAKRLRNLVPKQAKRFLLGAGRNINSEEKGQHEQLTKNDADIDGLQFKTTSDMEEVSAGPLPRYGFRLRVTTRDGRRCQYCPWYECCIGCFVPDDDLPARVRTGDSVAIDWHFAVDVATSGFGQRFNQIDNVTLSSQGNNSSYRSPKVPGVPIKNHSSCGAGSKKKGYAGAITLEDCLDAFAKEERIPEAYCSKCKDFRVQTKRMSLWRLPPIVIIHLKRFQFTQHMRRKLRDLVVFPVEGLDLSRIMASDSTVKLEKNNSPINSPKTKEKMNGGLETSSSAETTVTSNIDESIASNDLNASRNSISSDDGRQHMLYDLYGVVHHQGALSGGHYVASLKSDIDGQWRLFNDATIYEIHSRDVVDSSAYILFYIRRDVKGARLSDYWDTSAREGEGLSEEDMDKLIRGRSDRCVIS